MKRSAYVATLGALTVLVGTIAGCAQVLSHRDPASDSASTRLPWSRLAETDPARHSKMMSSAYCRDFLHYTTENDLTYLWATDSFMAIRDGQVMLEYYDSPYKPETPHRLWSATKLMTNLIVGTAVQEGRLRLDQKLEEFFPAETYRKGVSDHDLYRKITIRDLLLLQSGFDWQELETSDVTQLTIFKILFSSA